MAVHQGGAVEFWRGVVHRVGCRSPKLVLKIGQYTNWSIKFWEFGMYYPGSYHLYCQFVKLWNCFTVRTRRIYESILRIQNVLPRKLSPLLSNCQIVKLFHGQIYLRIIACCRLHMYWRSSRVAEYVADDDNSVAVFSPSWPFFESECDGLSSDLWYLQISFELLTSTLHDSDHASDIVGSVSNQAQQLLRWLH